MKPPMPTITTIIAHSICSGPRTTRRKIRQRRWLCERVGYCAKEGRSAAFGKVQRGLAGAPRGGTFVEAA